MIDSIDALAHRLRPAYSLFLGGRGDEILLTGHSHQAWPDVAREGQLAAFDDAARSLDGKWSRVFGEILPRFRRQVAARIGTRREADLAVAPNTHELVSRLAGCFPARSKVVTTEHEFHSLSRQLRRLEEDGLSVVRVAAGDDMAERLADSITKERPTWVAVSSVLFTTSRIVAPLEPILDAAARVGAPVLVDAYHAFNVVELEVDRWPGEVFVTGGGYKYAQSGEGCCWMLLPADAERYRPVNTGWFADFEGLEHADQGRIAYGSGGQRFMGATFDPTAFFRAVWVMEWMQAAGLTVPVLRQQSVRQTELIVALFAQLGLEARGLSLASPTAAAHRGGFVAFSSKEAAALVHRLAAKGVRVDARGDFLRLGPAPYTTSAELQLALLRLADVCR